MRTLSDHVKSSPSFGGALTNGSQNGADVDTFGYRRFSLLFAGKTVTSTAQVKLQTSTTGGGAGYTDVAGATLAAPIGAGLATFSAYIDVDPTACDRYVRAVVTGTAADSSVAALILLHEATAEPVDQDITPVKVS